MTDPVSALAGVGPKREQALAEAGIRTVGDLLHHLPVRYEDRRHVRSVTSVSDDALPVTVSGHLRALTTVRTRRRSLVVVRGKVEDASGSMDVVWFNRPYLSRQIEPRETYTLHGRCRRRRDKQWELLNPSVEPAQQAAGLVPIYRGLGTLGPSRVRRLIEAVLERLDPRQAVTESLPKELLQRHQLPPLGQALFDLQDPLADLEAPEQDARRAAARQRLVYGELLDLQLSLARARNEVTAITKPHRYRVTPSLLEQARDLLPFALTAAQRRVLSEIEQDLRSPRPMTRLLQGDVGSGKTAVALLAAVQALESGLQAAFMAPTELLAEQHHRTLKAFVGDRYPLRLLTAAADEAEAVRHDLERGETVLVVGTQALYQAGVSFSRLGLVVVDEQHRFGVEQRRRLRRKGVAPDLLVMTATPIPRSLALCAYGDLDLSSIDELPPGRSPVATEVVAAQERRAVYRRLRRALEEGAQAFVVFPLIEESDSLAAESVARLGVKLRSWLSTIPSAIVHGRLERADRETVMADFVAGKTRLLIATTVVEVGVDVPQATWMVIESAERFGLAQLHQLRGRVGRGVEPAHCVALHGDLTAEARRRLDVFGSTHDGFQIAEADLEIRGPGEILGHRQAGESQFRYADPREHLPWLEIARQDAVALSGSRQDLDRGGAGERSTSALEGA